MLFGDFVRSPYAHARVKSIDIPEAGAGAARRACHPDGQGSEPLNLHWMPTLAGDKQMVLGRRQGAVPGPGSRLRRCRRPLRRRRRGRRSSRSTMKSFRFWSTRSRHMELGRRAGAARGHCRPEGRRPRRPSPPRTTSSPGNSATEDATEAVLAEAEVVAEGDDLLSPHASRARSRPAAASPRWTRSTAS